MDSEVLIDTWTVLKEYIKEKQSAADHWIGLLIDEGVQDEVILDLAAVDKYLAKAVEYNGIDLDEDDEDESSSDDENMNKIEELKAIKQKGIVRSLMIEGIVNLILAMEIQQRADDLKNPANDSK